MIIGIIGGGQLGMMIAEEAIKLGHTVYSLDPQKDCSITSLSAYHIVSEYNNIDGITELVNISDVITYEFENVSANVLSKIEEKLPQKTNALKVSQNRLYEKNLAQELAIPTPRFQALKSLDDVFTPSIVKHVTGGYDGKGQYVCLKSEDIDQISNIIKEQLIIEEYISFDYEISIVSTRDMFGNIVFYPTPINKHKNGILYTSKIGSDIPGVIIEKAQKYTTSLLTSLDYVGSLTVEFFVKGNDVIFNEFAPRPHNSGHYTIEGCNVSQFKNHVLAITNKQVVQPYLVTPCIMVNVLGQDQYYYNKAMTLDDVFVHNYNKKDTRHNRKMGHITITGSTTDTCNEKLMKITGE